jgi:hypothetical protein
MWRACYHHGAINEKVMQMKRKRSDRKQKGDSLPTDVVGRREFRPAEAVLNQFIEAFGPLLRDLLDQLRVSVDDFDREAWGEFATAYFGYTFGRPEDKRRLGVVVERVLMNKLQRLRQ